MSFPVRAVVLDWAGTMIDFGCMAPVHALRDVFAEEGVDLSVAEARADMGKAKLDHLTAILRAPKVSARWRAAKNHEATDQDVMRIYRNLEPAMKTAAEQAATLIPGAAEMVKALRAKGIKIGSGTGYTREMMANILPRAAEQGYVPDALICAGETPSGRPSPLMAWAAMIQMDAWPAQACIKVDDAPVGITEGKLAGCWTVGLSASGNGVGLTLQDFQALSEDERSSKLAIAEQQLRDAGADFVITDISQLMGVVDEIARRMSAP